MNRTRGLFLILMLLAGCAGTHKYTCGVPEGLGCQPVGEVYAASVAGTLTHGNRPRQNKETPDKMGPSGPEPTSAADIPIIATIQPGDPLLTRPRHLRVWINRWEDAAGDLHDETYLYLRLDDGHWRLGP